MKRKRENWNKNHRSRVVINSIYVLHLEESFKASFRNERGCLAFLRTLRNKLDRGEMAVLKKLPTKKTLVWECCTYYVGYVVHTIIIKTANFPEKMLLCMQILWIFAMASLDIFSCWRMIMPQLKARYLKFSFTARWRKINL